MDGGVGMTMKNILEELRVFVHSEHKANQAKLNEVWEKPLETKLRLGESQLIAQVNIEDKNHLSLKLGDSDSRFREGDMICLHSGDVVDTCFVHQASIVAEDAGEWLVHAFALDAEAVGKVEGVCYADPDAMDLTPFYHKALDDIAQSNIGRQVLLPLLAGNLSASHIFADNYDRAADTAEAMGFNDEQADAVGKGVAAQYLACIQGPPGTGKTKVISLIARLLVDEGQRVLLTSHTHMAINNALNKIYQQQVPVIKVGSLGCTKGLDDGIELFKHADDWKHMPDTGYVIGATPFATCTSRLEDFEFDTVIFDEASQITVPLALMAMRKAKRYVFVGDHKQLPPVVLSSSVLDNNVYSIFSRLVESNKEVFVMLNKTYRMNQVLTEWPSRMHYGDKLVSIGGNAHRQFLLDKNPSKYETILAKENAFVYMESPGTNARTSNMAEAELVADIICVAYDAGANLKEIGVVTPFRNQGKAIRNILQDRLGLCLAKEVVTDTVERMQGQEREMIIISLCTNDEQFLTAIAPFFFQEQRLNVAITRAMTKLILIGPRFTRKINTVNSDKKLLANILAYGDLLQAAVELDARSI